MLIMAWNTPGLWKIAVFNDILKQIVGTGLLTMILAFHFSANKNDEKRVDNTGKALEAIKAAQEAPPPPPPEPKPDYELQPGETAQAVEGEVKND